MLIYILLFCFILMLIGAYFIFKKEVMHPVIIFLAMYTVSVFCAVCNIEKWGIEMSKATFLILLLGAVEFAVVSYITQKYYAKKTKYKEIKPKMKKIEVPKIIIYAIILYTIIVIAIQLLVVFDIAGRFGKFSGLSEALTLYKEHTSYNKDVDLPSYLTIMQCGVIAGAFAVTLIFINNILVSENKLKYIRNNISYIFPSILFIISYLVQSNRGMIIDFVVSMLTIGILMWTQKYDWKKHIKIKTIISIGLIGIIGLIIFYYSATLIGRINTKGMFDYITYYCGGSIECFNQYVKNEKQIKMVRGEETFYSLILNLDSFGITDYDLGERESGHLEFIYYEDEMVGNIYTAYRRWMNDFGILGIVVFQGIMAAFFTILYNRAKYNNGKQGNLWILIYGYLAYTIYMHPMDGYLYFEVLSKAGIARFVSVVTLYIILENWNNIIDFLKGKLKKYTKQKEEEKKERKNILVFGITENPGGVESVIMNYYRNIDREKYHFDFLCNSEEVAYEDEIMSLGGKIFKITARSKDYKKYKEDMKNFFEKNAKEYDVIWVNVCSLANIDYLKYAKKYGIKRRIIHSHNSKNMDSFLRGMVHRLNKFIIEDYATDFWACSEDAGKWFYSMKIRDSEKYVIINNAIDLDKYKYNPKIREEYRKKLGIEDKFVIGNIGRLHFQKNQAFLLEIFKEICNINENSYLLIGGQGEEEEKLKAKAKELGIEENVKFLGMVKNVQDVLQAMDAFVFPSLFEGLAVVLIEAQASGLNVFASKDVMPIQAKMSKYFRFISLFEDEKEWAKIIIDECNHCEVKRENRINDIAENGFDIKLEAKKLEKYFS